MNDDELVSRTRAAEVLKRNGRTVNAALEGVPPDEAKPGRPKRWKISTVKAALAQRDTLNADYIRNGATASSTASLTKARAKLAHNKAAIAEMQRKRLEGELVPAAEVEMLWAHQVAVARARLLAIPAKCAVRVKMGQTTAEVATILRQEVYAALDELSRSGSGRHGDGTAGDPRAT